MKLLFSLQRNLAHITAALSIFSFATSLVGVFIPLIMLEAGAPLPLVAGFYVLYALVKLVINYPVVRIIQRYGAHVGLACGFIAGTILLAAILGYNQTKLTALLVLAAAALSFTNAFLWSSQHLHISRVMDASTKSSSLATMAIINKFLGILAPLIGGFVGLTFGSGWLLILALVVAASALIPLRGMSRLEAARQPEPHLRYDLRGAPPRDLFANFCFNIDTAIGVMAWPIYLALVIGTFKGIGLISALAALVTMIVVWIAGHRGDRGRDRSVLRQGVAGSSFAHILRLFASTPLTIAAVSSIYQGSLSYLTNAWTSTYYHHTKRSGTAYVMSMEIACDIAYLVIWGIFLGLSLVVNHQVLFWIIFSIAAISSWGCLAISRQGELESPVA